MQRLKLMGLAILAVFAVSAVAVATASAENPTILPAPTTSAPLKFTSTSGAGTLETKAGRKIECTADSNTGEFTSSNSGKVTVTFTGCVEPKSGSKCKTGTETAGTILLSGAGIQLTAFKNGTVLELGAGVTLASNLVIKCGVVAIEVKGTALGVISGVTTGVKTKTATLKLTQTGGVQSHTTCELPSGFCASKTYTLESTFGSGFEQSAEATEDAITFEKEAAVDF